MDPYSLFIGFLWLFVVGTIGLLGFIFFRIMWGTESRASIFKRLAKEYRLTFSTESYPPLFIVLPGETYRARSLKGVIAGKEVVVEDCFYSAYKDAVPYGVALLLGICTHPRISNHLPARPQETTRLIVNGTEVQLNPEDVMEEALPGIPTLGRLLPGYPVPASYAQIKDALDHVI